jgi:hypothetical protein
VYKSIGGFKGYLHRIGDMTFFSKLLLEYKVAFCPDKLQRITVWTNKRNESARNTDDPLGLIFERSLFLGNYFSAEALNQIEFIFPIVAPVVKRACKSVEGRRFVMGCYISLISAPDYISIGANQMFIAYEASPSEIENIAQLLMETTFGQLMYILSQNPQQTPFCNRLILAVKFHLKKFKAFRRLNSFFKGMRKNTSNKISPETFFKLRESSTKVGI